MFEHNSLNLAIAQPSVASQGTSFTMEQNLNGHPNSDEFIYTNFVNISKQTRLNFSFSIILNTMLDTFRHIYCSFAA